MDDRQSRFLDLMREHHGRWRAVARSYAGNGADDLLQEILLQIWKSLESYRGDAAVSTWTYRIALNTAMKWKRTEKTRQTNLPTEHRPGCLVAPSSSDVSQPSLVLERLMQNLSPADRAILLLSLDDISYEQMAEIVGISSGALRVRVHRIKQKLADSHLGEDDEF